MVENTEYLLPVKIHPIDGCAENTESLLKSKTRQIGLGENDVATIRGKTRIVFDFGKEIQGGVRLLTHYIENGSPVRIRFGEALSGTTGAAVATVIGQFCGAGAAIFFNLKKNPDIQLDWHGFRPSADAIKRIYIVGLPSIAMQCVGSVMTFLMNKILMAFSATAVAVFGVYFKLQSFVFMPIFGMNNGMVPIISYNYGARRPDRVKKTIKLAMCYAEGIMLIGFLLFQFAPDKLLSFFAASDAMLAIGIPALRIICLHFLLAGMSIILSSSFQALGNGMFSLIVSICRQLVVLIPAAWLLSQTGNVNMVWWSFVIAELVSVTMSFALFAQLNKKIIAPLYN